jgi:hypothetical protein
MEHRISHHFESLSATAGVRGASIALLLACAGPGFAALPCDIYAAGGTPCVAAHSSVRALYSAYTGNLYQVKRGSDSTTKDIPVLSTGGYANSALQDQFCANTTCTISILYDQSGKGNHLTAGPGGGAVKTPDKRVVATAEKLKIGGNTVYGMKFTGGMGYRNDKTSGIATGDLPESMYMVTSGVYFNSLCCFDYGNAETDNLDDGAGTMEAIYFGNQSTYWGWGNTSVLTNGKKGPWVEADMENGLFAGNVFGEYKGNNPVPYTYVTAMLKGKAGTWALKSGNSTTGKLTTQFEGTRPTVGAYNPMKKQGAIILGIGGDNSNGSQGIFYEGAMTTGYATNATDSLLQENIVATGYGLTTNAISTSVPREAELGRLHVATTASRATIEFDLAEDLPTTIRVLDARGQVIAAPSSGLLAAGHHEVGWDISGLRAGIYFVRLDAIGAASWSGKLVVER